jgi:hypothetical protein
LWHQYAQSNNKKWNNYSALNCVQRIGIVLMVQIKNLSIFTATVEPGLLTAAGCFVA